MNKTRIEIMQEDIFYYLKENVPALKDAKYISFGTLGDVEHLMHGILYAVDKQLDKIEGKTNPEENETAQQYI